MKKKVLNIIICLISIILLIVLIYNIVKSNIRSINGIYLLGIVSLISIFSLSLFYMIIKDIDRNLDDKVIIYIFSNILLVGLFSTITIYILSEYLNTKNIMTIDTKKEIELDTSNVISNTNITLDKYDNDITIINGGNYTISGNYKHSIIINSDEEVNLILDNVNINNNETASIIGLKASKITITTKTDSTLTDGGTSQYDGCIYSNAPLVFEGNGTLTINGNQNEGEGIASEAQNITFNSGTYVITSNDDGINAGGDGATITINDGIFYINASGDGIDSNKDAIINGGTIFVIGSDIGGDSGIDTDSGYLINGGTLVALGSDMIEVPKSSSKQNTLALTLDNSINKNTLVTLMKENEEIISFIAPKNFKTIIISTSNLINGTYYLYQNGSTTSTEYLGIYNKGKITLGNKITIDNNDTFKVSKIINEY